ncbi:hypothetical protein DEEACLCL_00206 [Salmonella phage CRW-SP2]|nr:hypothetical protein DEEACLCL_00206 [Salmonella phage CRW-SP2]
MTTTFQKNRTLNLAFGNEAGDVLKFTPNLERVRNQAKLVIEEARELIEAVYFNKNVVFTFELQDKPDHDNVIDSRDIIKNILDAQGDITTVNDGVAHILGVDGDEILQRVYASNMSKFIRNAKEVAPALQYYYDLGFEEGMLDVEGEFPRAFIRVVETVTVNGKEYPKGKFLKNMATFKEPDFTDLISDNPKRQTTSIVCSMGIPENEFGYSSDNRVAVTDPGFFQRVINNCGHGYVEHIKFKDQTESAVPVFYITEEHFPDVPAVWGMWKGNVRHYFSTPANAPITELIRID